MVPPLRPHRPQRRNESAVRVGALERTLETFNKEMGQKVAFAIGRYHRIYHAPWYEKLWRWFRPCLELYGLPPAEAIEAQLERAQAQVLERQSAEMLAALVVAAREEAGEPSKLILPGG